MAPEDPFAGINPERLAMMQSMNNPSIERGGGNGRRGGQGGDRDRGWRSSSGGWRYGANGGQAQGRKTTFDKNVNGAWGSNGKGNGGAEPEPVGTSAPQREKDREIPKKLTQEMGTGSEIIVTVGKGEKKKRKRGDETEVMGGDTSRSRKDRKRKRPKGEEITAANGPTNGKKSKSKDGGKAGEEAKEAAVGGESLVDTNEPKLSKEERKAAKAARKAAKEVKKAEREQKKGEREGVTEKKKSKSKPKQKAEGTKGLKPKSNGEKRRKTGKAGGEDKKDETSEVAAWDAAQLSGGDERKAKFLRLLGAGAGAIPPPTTNGSGKPPMIAKRDKELEKQFDIGMKMKNEGGKKRGLGAL